MTDERILKQATAYSVLLMCMIFLFSILRGREETFSYASAVITPTAKIESIQNVQPTSDNDEVVPVNAWEELFGDGYEMIKERVGEKCIILKKDDTFDEETIVSLEDLAVDRSICVTISGLSNTSYRVEELGRISSDQYFKGVPPSPTPTIVANETITPEAEQIVTEEKDVQDLMLQENQNNIETNLDSTQQMKANVTIDTQNYSDNTTMLQDTNYTDPVEAVSYQYLKREDSDLLSLELMIRLDTTYAYEFFEDDRYIYISLRRPKDVYRRIVVLDAGHGGLDSGTYSRGNTYLEKDFNLDMMLYVKEKLESEDIKVYCTRTTDRRLTLSQRVDLANAVEADFFLSIHCNANISSNVHGIEVLYNDKQDSWNRMNSKTFSMICLEEVNQLAKLRSRGIIPRSHNVTIIGESKVPVALVEVAYMSNSSDLKFLQKEENRNNAALGMYHAIMRSYEVLVLEQKNTEAAKEY